MGLAPPLTYFGGKTSVAARIAELLPAHGHYVEPFCGGLSVLLAKGLSSMETVNDLDGNLMTFWRVLRDRPGDLVRACGLTPHGRAEYAAADLADGEMDEVERARRVWVQLTQGRGGSLRPTGWRYHVDPAGSATAMPGYLDGYLRRMWPVAERLRQVSLEARSAREVIEQYGRHERVLLYVDPPYLGSTRSGSTSAYRHEMKTADAHADLLAQLVTVRATVVLSGYRSALYDAALAGWDRVEIASGTGQGSVWGERTEVLWCNRRLRGERTLFDAVAGERS